MPASMHVRAVFPCLAAIFLAVAVLASPVAAQDRPPPGMSGDNPTAQAVQEQKLLEELRRIQGSITIPDPKAAVLQQPQGRTYQSFHEVWLPWIGGIAVIGMLLLLAAFFFYRGRIRTHDPLTGQTILRFNAVERFTHWLTATAFIILAITGLNYVFGKRLLMPLIGPEAFSSWSQWAKYAHIATSWIFMAGILIMFVLWIKDNLPDRYDWAWLKGGGGMFDKRNETHPPASRFNAGQKLIFWIVVLGGAALSVSGLYLLFPFDFADINQMQIAQYFHGAIGMLMIAVIIAHIYIGTLGMEGAFQAMGTGEVDTTWAREHHRIWVEREQARTETGRRQVPPHPAATSAD